MSILNKYNCKKQHDDKDCGVACLATVAKHYGEDIPISVLRELSGTDLDGTSIYGIRKAAEKIGFNVKCVKASNKEEIFSTFPKPAIAHLIVNGDFPHYVVIHEISKRKIIVADPAVGIVSHNVEEFFRMWSGALVLLTPSDSFKCNKKNDNSFIMKLLHLIKLQNKLFIKMFILSILVTLLGIIGTFYYKILIDNIIPNNNEVSLVSISILMLVLASLKVVTEFFRSIMLIHLSQNIDVELLLGYYNHIIDLPMNFFSTRKVGDIISRFNDADKIREAISSTTLTIMIDVIMTIVGAIFLYRQSARMFIYCFAPLCIYLFLVKVFNKVLKDSNRNVMEKNSKLTSYLIESIEGIETVKAFNAEKDVKIETKNRFMEYIKAVFKFSYVNNLQSSLKGGVKGSFAIIILWIGSYLIINKDITVGTLISFNALIAYFIDPIERIINLQPQIESAIVAADRLNEILVLEREKNEKECRKISPTSLFGNIDFKGVNFRYGAKDLVLRNISMNIESGQNIALVGESGSGKTTIAKLLMNYYQVENGSILINGQNINDINRETLRKKIAYISQETFLFSGTIMENLKFANKEASSEEIIDICKKTQIHNFIVSLPLGYETMLEEKGINLSGGQRQRLAIARALLKKPEILIMDEATSNLDSITEIAIGKTIKDCTDKVTTIIIAHRLSTIRRCSKIYVMEKGNIVEEGSHDELISRKGFYYTLWSGQTSSTYIETDHTMYS